MFKDSKYSKFLTILLIILIIGMLIGIGFLAFNAITGYINDREISKTLEEFDSDVKKVEEDDNNNNEVELNESSRVPGGGGNNNNNTSSSSARRPISYNTTKVIGVIKISKTKIEYPIYSEVTIDTLNKGVAKQYGAGLNKVGNTVIAGHNYRNGKFFSNNKNIEVGDKIQITDEDKNTITYTVYKTYSTTPEDTSYFIRDTNGAMEISLTTCSDDSKERLIIWAKAD